MLPAAAGADCKSASKAEEKLVFPWIIKHCASHDSLLLGGLVFAGERLWRLAVTVQDFWQILLPRPCGKHWNSKGTLRSCKWDSPRCVHLLQPEPGSESGQGDWRLRQRVGACSCSNYPKEQAPGKSSWWLASTFWSWNFLPHFTIASPFPLPEPNVFGINSCISLDNGRRQICIELNSAMYGLCVCICFVTQTQYLYVFTFTLTKCGREEVGRRTPCPYMRSPMRRKSTWTEVWYLVTRTPELVKRLERGWTCGYVYVCLGGEEWVGERIWTLA